MTHGIFDGSHSNALHNFRIYIKSQFSLLYWFFLNFDERNLFFGKTTCIPYLKLISTFEKTLTENEQSYKCLKARENVGADRP